MSETLTNNEILQMDKDYEPEEKREMDDRRTAISSYCDPAMDRRSYDRRSENGRS